MPKEAEDLIGQVFGTRKVLSRGRNRTYGDGKSTLYWRTECLSCGHKAEIQGGQLRRGSGCMGCRRRCQGSQDRTPRRKERQITREKPPKIDTAMSLTTEDKPVVTWGHIKRLMADVSDDLPVEITKIGERSWSFMVVLGPKEEHNGKD